VSLAGFDAALVELTVGHDTIAGGLAATTHVDDVRFPEATSLPTRPDDTGLPRAVEDALEQRIEAAVQGAVNDFEVVPWVGSFDELEALLRRDSAAERKKEGPGVCMSAFTIGEGRTPKTEGLVGRFRQQHLITTTKLLGLDFESLPGDPFDFVAPFAGCDALIYSTHSHGRLEECREKERKKLKKDVVDDEVEARARAPRFRLVLRLKRHVTWDEYRKLWLWADRLCGGGSDESCKDATRFYYTPRRKADDAVYEPFIVRWRGDALDPDALPDGRKVSDLPHPDDEKKGRATGANSNSGERKSAVSAADAAGRFAALDEETRRRVGEVARADVKRTIERLREPKKLDSRRKHLYVCGCRIGERSGFSDDVDKFVDEFVALTLQTALDTDVPDPHDHERQVRNGVHKGQQDHVPVEQLVAKTAKKSDKQRSATKNEVLALVDTEGLVYDDYLEASYLQDGVEPPWNPSRPGPRKLDDQDAVDVTLWIENTKNLKVDENLAGRMLWRAAKNRPVDSLRDYLQGVQWDGIQRLDTWLSVYLGADENDYTMLVGRKWLIQAVARALNPGCKADGVLVLEGKQGVQKSTALSVLGGSGRFFTDQLPDNLADKDASLAMNGTWIVEMADLHSLSKTRVTTMKAFITRQVDRFRPPYGKNLIDTPRRSVLAGTTNEKGYLVDETGNRRFWPVACGENAEEGDPAVARRIQALRNDVDKLWAEAVVAYNSGEAWWLTTREEVRLSRGAQEERVVENPLALMLERRLAGVEYEPPDGKKVSSPVVQLTMEDALSWAYEMNDPNHKKDSKAVAQILLKNGFRRVRGVTKAGPRPWVYVKDGYTFCARESALWGYGHLTQAEYEDWVKAEEEWLAETKRGVDALADATRGEGRAKVREKN
jgi:predicted P-loop ATPase